MLKLDRIKKIGYIQCYLSLILLFSVEFYLVVCPPTNQYEFSIYSFYPDILWLSLIVIVFFSIVSLIFYIRHKETNFFLTINFVFLVLCNSILLFLPLIRGYKILGNGDILTHIGYVKDIINYSNIGDNVYPLLHILSVSIHYCTGMDINITTLIIPQIFWFLFVLSVFILGRQIFEDRISIIVLLFLGSLLIYKNTQLMFVPYMESFYFIPFVLYLIFKTNKKQDLSLYLLLILICIFITFFHPLTTLILVFLLLIIKTTGIIFEKRICPAKKVIDIKVTYLIFIIITIFISWSSYLILVARSALPLINELAGATETTSQFAHYNNLISGVNVDIFYLLKLIFSMYGQWILLTLLSVICMCYLILNYKQITYIQFLSINLFLLFFIISAISFVSNSPVSFWRFFNIAMFFSILLIASSSTYLLKIPQKLDGISINIVMKTFFIFTLLIAMTYFSTFNLYLSPTVKLAGEQVSDVDISAMNNFYLFRDNSLSIKELGISQGRFYDYIYGSESARENVESFMSTNVNPPDHFGYTQNKNFYLSYHYSSYLIINAVGRYWYYYIYPEFPDKWRFTENDFNRLSRDPSVNKIFMSENFDINYINQISNHG